VILQMRVSLLVGHSVLVCWGPDGQASTVLPTLTNPEELCYLSSLPIDARRIQPSCSLIDLLP
jgi:hypothetical protein